MVTRMSTCNYKKLCGNCKNIIAVAWEENTSELLSNKFVPL